MTEIDNDFYYKCTNETDLQLILEYLERQGSYTWLDGSKPCDKVMVRDLSRIIHENTIYIFIGPEDHLLSYLSNVEFEDYITKHKNKPFPYKPNPYEF